MGVFLKLCRFLPERLEIFFLLKSYDTIGKFLKVSLYDAQKSTKSLSDSYVEIQPTESGDLLSNLEKAYNYSAAAYNKLNALEARADIAKNNKVQEFYATIGNKKIPAGIVITDSDGNITVSYHGTEFIHGYQDLWSDLNMLHKKVDDIGINGNAHRGFLDRYLQSRGALNDIS